MWLLPRRATRIQTAHQLHQAHIVYCYSAAPPRFQQRTFLNSILGSALGECRLRHLTHTKTIPYSPSSIFKAVSDVSGYPSFLPFTISSNVTSRDERGYPTEASLKVGYDKFGLKEDWNSIVKCDPEKGIVEAKSSKSDSQGLFEVLQTKWHIDTTNTSGNQTRVKLDLDVKFRNPVYDQMFAQVEDKVVSTMIAAFERRVQELESASKK